jgi:hypothetical protein
MLCPRLSKRLFLEPACPNFGDVCYHKVPRYVTPQDDDEDGDCIFLFHCQYLKQNITKRLCANNQLDKVWKDTLMA